MASRQTLGSATPGVILGDTYMDNVAAHLNTLYNSVSLPLMAVAGTANAVTATLDPPLLGALVEGMRFSMTWGITNTANVTLSINGATALPVVDATGAVLVAGGVTAGLRSTLEYFGAQFRITTSILNVPNTVADYVTFNSSGTWIKPSGYGLDKEVIIEMWAGGGGGGTLGGGGGGGGYIMERNIMQNLQPSEAIVIGAGGAVNGAGGNTTFGNSALPNYMTAYGGGGGGTAAMGGGGGGGALGAGATASTAAGATGGSLGGGTGASTTVPASNGLEGGGGGGSAAGGKGGSSLYGGGGGGGVGGGPALKGQSLYGGDGGDGGFSGEIPGGGGSRNVTGGRGQVRIWI